jgi:ADP-heptose:LPS heptosyltransferase
VPALRALRRAFPDRELVLAAPAWLAPLARLSGAVDRLVPHRGLEPLPAELAQPALAVNLHGRGPESHRTLLAARPRGLIAFRCHGVPESAAMPRWRADEHEVERWCRLLRECGIAASRDDLELDRRPLRGGPRALGATLVHPGAASGARRWPAERFAAVARHERERGRRVVVTGGDGERGLAARVALEAGLDPRDVLAGRTRVLDLASLVASAGRVVCGDTGVAHLATALGTPSVVLFGPTSPALWGPPPGRPRHRAIWHGGSGDPHAALPDSGLLEITVEEVLAELEALEETTSEPRRREEAGHGA